MNNKYKGLLLGIVIIISLIGVFAFTNNQIPLININNDTNSDSSYNYVDTTTHYKNASYKNKTNISTKPVQNITPTPTPKPKPNNTNSTNTTTELEK